MREHKEALAQQVLALLSLSDHASALLVVWRFAWAVVCMREQI
jgi:hypothetical protein